MTQPCIITVAITGSVPTKKDNPAVPVTVAEQIESTHASFEAGASLAHIHVRNDDGTVSSNPDRFAKVQEGLNKHCPGMIIQFSTGGRSGVGSERGGMLHHRPDMASLSTGSCNFPLRIYENHPDLIKELAPIADAKGGGCCLVQARVASGNRGVFLVHAVGAQLDNAEIAGRCFLQPRIIALDNDTGFVLAVVGQADDTGLQVGGGGYAGVG